ncbi:MAG TPA: hypothetical protein P5136_02625 [Methanofastidiosum sp.]|nr:hypothetical protein [Methanofastidiosum sp.]
MSLQSKFDEFKRFETHLENMNSKIRWVGTFATQINKAGFLSVNIKTENITINGYYLNVTTGIFFQENGKSLKKDLGEFTKDEIVSLYKILPDFLEKLLKAISESMTQEISICMEELGMFIFESSLKED